MTKRIKTKYPGVFYQKAQRIGGPGTEKVYYVVFKKEGKVIEEKAGRQFVDDMSPSRKQIREAEQEKRAAESNKWTIKRLWEAYKNDYPMKGIKTDENRFEKHLKDVFAEKEPQDIIPLDVDRLGIRLLKKLSPQTVKHILVLLKRIVNYGVKKQLCEPLSFNFDMPKVDNQKTETLTTDQLSALLKAIDEDHDIQAQNIMRMALYTGMRRGELFRLQWSDLDFDREFITIRNPAANRQSSP